MEETKKDEQSLAAGIDDEFEKSVDELANVFLENVERNYDSQIEPFESYANRMRLEIHKNMEEYRNRFLKGYEVLLMELSQQYADSENKSVKGEDSSAAISSMMREAGEDKDSS